MHLSQKGKNFHYLPLLINVSDLILSLSNSKLCQMAQHQLEVRKAGNEANAPIRLISKLSTKMWLQNLKTTMVVYSVY